MKKIIKDIFSIIFKIKKKYKCIAYIKDITDNNTDSIVEAFEIEEYTDKRAYNEAYNILKLKYSDKVFDIRISNK